MADCEIKHTSSPPPKQLSQTEVVAGVKKIIAHKFNERELLELRSYINGLLQVASKGS